MSVLLSLVPWLVPWRPQHGVESFLVERSSSPSPSTSRNRKTRRPRGTGSLFVKRDSAGQETWYGKWWVGKAQVKRRIGPKRAPSTRQGLTRTQAEAELRRMIGAIEPALARRERITVAEAGELHVARVRMMGRKRATVQSYDSVVRVQLAPYFGARTLDRIGRREIEGFIAHMARSGRSAKTTRNALGVLHSIFEYARREEWVLANPCTLVDKPTAPEGDPDIHFLDQEEVEALLRSVPDDDLGRVERRMYLTAAMTGMRQGELLALRWLDIDWPAQRVRIRRNFVRGEFGTPKSKRSSRSVPLADRLAGELNRLHQETPYRHDDDLVFAHPRTGKPIDRSKLLKRFKAALERGGVRPVRFHDLRHTFGTRMAAQGVPMRALQEMMGHRDFKTTLIYADYAPSAREAEWVEAAFRSGSDSHGIVVPEPSGFGDA
jgi:integrase